MKIGLVSCSLEKLGWEMQAQNLYISRTFKARRKFVERTCDAWYIMSSKYGLVSPTTHINTYEDWLHNWSKEKRREWQRWVLTQVLTIPASLRDSVVIHSGKSYYDLGLEEGLRAEGIEVEIPTRGLSNLQTFSWLKANMPPEKVPS